MKLEVFSHAIATMKAKLIYMEVNEVMGFFQKEIFLTYLVDIRWSYFKYNESFRYTPEQK